MTEAFTAYFHLYFGISFESADNSHVKCQALFTMNLYKKSSAAVVIGVLEIALSFQYSLRTESVRYQ